jgi:hypothetical protein
MKLYSLRVRFEEQEVFYGADIKALTRLFVDYWNNVRPYGVKLKKGTTLEEIRKIMNEKNMCGDFEVDEIVHDGKSVSWVNKGG